MNRDDFRRFSAALTAAAELYGKPLSEGAMSLWWDALKGYEIDTVEQALRAVIRDPDGGQFMPKPADLIRRIDGTAADRSLIAWGKVLDAMRRVGAYSSVVFDDGAIHAAIDDMGGWPKLCRGTTDELPFVQRRFCEAHRVYSTRPDLRYPARLAGEHEGQNALRGFKTPPPAIVGDPERAKVVQSLGDAAGGRTSIAFDALLPPQPGEALPQGVKRLQGVTR